MGDVVSEDREVPELDGPPLEVQGPNPQGYEVRSVTRIDSTAPSRVVRRMGNVREAFRLRRLARVQRRNHSLFEEHNLFTEACVARREMMRLLRTARAAWRRALGFSMEA